MVQAPAIVRARLGRLDGTRPSAAVSEPWASDPARLMGVTVRRAASDPRLAHGVPARAARTDPGAPSLSASALPVAVTDFQPVAP